ncbi:cytochrome P450 [Lophiostoma macrostomum CBS 122681]|uniref:Cytochrome P450 n=1 Tax=Lophiostoma macrostomum CBS 122681 TaxID=1314788 RepID=A0A6A6SIN7_9PLEO|nr:cytochrome P450 [Lophiostoma macrostomum CBS 122681]
MALRPKKRKQPPHLPECIPCVSNTFQYLTDMGSFLHRISGIVGFTLVRKQVYMVAGARYTQNLLGPPHIMDPNMFHTLLMDKHWNMSKNEIKLFENDTSGRRKTPTLGMEHIPTERRHWYNHHLLYAEFLSSAKYTQCLADTFLRLFSERLRAESSHLWTTVSLHEFMKLNMTEAAIKSMFGSKILELNPDLIRTYWEFDEVAGILVWGLPRFLSPHPYAIRDRLHSMTSQMTDYAWQNFDWNGPDVSADWDPYFGSRFSREVARWFRNAGFSDRTASGHTMATLFGLNGNTIPIATWMLMEIIQDPQLSSKVRSEVDQAFVIDETGQRQVDIKQLFGLPLIQSIYIEVLRMHISFNVTREVKKDIFIDGYRIKKGSILQCPSQIAHYDEAAWGHEGHPASAFWAQRHLAEEHVSVASDSKVGMITPNFSMTARPTSFFPFGFGYAMCPGRHFAKREIIMAVAMIIDRFDIEFVNWTHVDGSVSDRSAQNDMKYAGTAGMPPDRDMRIRWKRRW